MKLSAILAVFSALLLQLVSAQIRLTEPLGESSWNFAKPPAVQWRPTKGVNLADLGSMRVSLWGGSTEMQTSLMEIGTIDATSRRLPVPAIPATLGPEGDYYFIRMHSSTKNKTHMSGKFTITGLTGAFNATMQAELTKGQQGPIVAAAEVNTTSSSAPGIASGRSMNSTSTLLKSTTSAAYRAADAAPFVSVIGLGLMLAIFSVL